MVRPGNGCVQSSHLRGQRVELLQQGAGARTNVRLQFCEPAQRRSAVADLPERRMIEGPGMRAGLLLKEELQVGPMLGVPFGLPFSSLVAAPGNQQTADQRQRALMALRPVGLCQRRSKAAD